MEKQIVEDNQNIEHLSQNSSGSIWHRWDPHIHIPGTMKEDKFGADADEAFIERLNKATPTIRVVGITDYCVLDSYKRAKGWHDNGEIPGVILLFPNIELRLAVNAGKGSPINLHVLISPEDPKHISEAESFLGKIRFKYNGEEYGCINRDLVRLGYAINSSAENDDHALKIGVDQFKVEADQLLEVFEKSAWARQNILIAVAGSSKDGSAQLQDDSGLSALRKKIERASAIVFSSREGDRNFWLGKSKAASADKISSEYGGLKPCLHGSDAHDLDTVGNPDQNRLCWLKGDPTFETLRQACIEPEGRAFVGGTPPNGGLPSHTIKSITISHNDWFENRSLQINSGLVAIIGERGSGKTALVEAIAAACGGVRSPLPDGSFLQRAAPFFDKDKSTVNWADGDNSEALLKDPEGSCEEEFSRVRFLSQQFVDRLCSSIGLAEDLVAEIERVVFLAHLPETRLNADNFAELREIKTAASKRAKERLTASLKDTEINLSHQRDLRRNLSVIEKKRKSEFDAIERDKTDRKTLTPSDNAKLLERLESVRAAADKIARNIASLQKKELDLKSLQSEIEQFSKSGKSISLNELMKKYPSAGLTQKQWGNFELVYSGDVTALLVTELKNVQGQIKTQKGPKEGEKSEPQKIDNIDPYFNDDTELPTQTLSLLRKEQRRLEAKVGIDEGRRQKYRALSEKISKAENALEKRDKEILEATNAQTEINSLETLRDQSYRKIFEEICKEESILKSLYEPLEQRLKSETDTLGKLAFSVKRNVDIESWAAEGESYLDVRKSGELRGKGKLLDIAKERFLSVWKSGSSDDAVNAMSEFRKEYGPELWKHIPDHAAQDRESKRRWFDQVSSWLAGTSHIDISYGLLYEGIEIQQLSPGTRGIVLLLLYLSVDREDDRPLIIDQPEENLDPKSIYDELVKKFKEAKTRRQIIVVTHNANLVVNTDADQVIVATRSAHRPGSLPVMHYDSGGLENPIIRKSVCDILEGGEKAFIERARRLRITSVSG